jgi:cell division protein FtsN
MRIQYPLNEDYDGDFYRYSVGSFEDIEEAKELKDYLKKIGFSDAFGIKIENNKRKQAF